MLGHRVYYILICGLFFNRNSFVSYFHVKPFNSFNEVQTMKTILIQKQKKQTTIEDLFKKELNFVW